MLRACSGPALSHVTQNAQKDRPSSALLPYHRLHTVDTVVVVVRERASICGYRAPHTTLLMHIAQGKHIHSETEYPIHIYTWVRLVQTANGILLVDARCTKCTLAMRADAWLHMARGNNMLNWGFMT